MFKHVLLSVWILLTGLTTSYGQTTLIGPSVNNGGFESATNTPWQIVNGTQTNKWVISTGANTGFSGTKAAYITKNTTAPYSQTYDINTVGDFSAVHLYQDVVFPAGQPTITFSFKYRVDGEVGYDQVLVYISNTATPNALTAGTPASQGTTALAGYDLLQTLPQSATSWTTINVPITAAQAGNTTAATTRRILFVWQNDDNTGADPSAGIDDVLLTSNCVPSPAPAGASSYSYCQNEPASPLVATGTNVLFYTTATGGTGSSAVPTPSTATPGVTTYYVTQNTNGCETAPRKAITVTVKATPPAPTLPAGGIASICQFSPPLTLNTVGLPGATIKYYATDTGKVPITLAPFPYNPSAPIVNIYVSQTVNGCESPRSKYIIASYPKPPPPVVSSPLNVCQFAITGPLTAGGQNINWYENANGGVPLLSAPVPQTNIGTPRADSAIRDTFFATQTVNGCESDRAFLEVIINYQPNATFIPSKRFVCVDDTISFVYYGNADANASYTWSIPRPQGREVSGQGTQGPFVARFDSVGTFDINLIVSANGCTSTPVYQRIEVRDRPQTRVNAKREVCIDEVVEISLDSMSPGISGYNFTFDGGKVEYATYDAGPFGVSWNTPGIKQVIVNSTSRLCGSRTQAELINVHASPAAIIRDKPTGNICAADSVRLVANDLGPGYTYTWTPSNIFQDRANRGITVFTTPFYQKGRYYAVLTVADSIGCEGQDNVEINTIPCCDVYFPNAFAPNSQNEKNNRFGMISLGVPTRYTLRIMNRWGRVMYETSDARMGWDGRYEGEAQPTGTYFYYAKYRCANGEDFEQKGEITLVR